jgi:hypothetical protein
MLLHLAGGTSSPPLHQPNLGEHDDKEYHKVRLQELRDREGAVVAQGLHPSITVVCANAAARTALLAALPSEGVLVVRACDLDAELRRAAEAAAERYEREVEEKRGLVEQAKAAFEAARRSMEEAAHEAKLSAVELEAFDHLAERLASAEEHYEAAARAEAETARSLATALSELDRALAQRQAASASVDEARKSRANLGVPEAVLQQAFSVQAALSEALASRHEAVEQAESTYHDARSAARQALAKLEAAHTALREGVVPSALYTTNGQYEAPSGVPSLAGFEPGTPPAPQGGPFGPGIPLPGLVGNYRDRLAARWHSAQTAEHDARQAEASARARLEQLETELEVLTSAGPTGPPESDVALAWAGATDLGGIETLVADDAFGRLGPEEVAAVLKAIAQRGCQAIYLTEDLAVLSWAIGLPREMGAATAATTPRSRPLALVGD